ncbi:hydrocephalus-inducing protein-like [Melospiza melodia melodia]|uniref:hydrocephalus-inducing protein-like n=1 Tax=Melospiza melodia melodia TaxID=1914991 RepID=UPI002FD565E3
MALSLMNKDKFPQVVKVSMESSPYFQLVSSNNAYRVVLPGASVPVRVRFTPDESKDYSHEFVCVTARERIVVPIVAIGARAVLDFPAQLDFSKCPVKHSTQQTLLVRNVGNLKTRYQLSTQSPFSVVPATGTLGAGETLQVTVTFHPLTKGDHCSLLSCSTAKTLLCFVPGEERIHTKLYGEAVDVNVGLSTNIVHVDTTYITTSTHRTVFIENRSNITAHFQWKAFPTEERENEVKRRRRSLLHSPSQVRLEKLTEEKKSEEEKDEDGAALLTSMAQEKMAEVQEDSMMFSDDIFFIEPMEGEIGPNCSAGIRVTFKPLDVLGYQSMAYLSISGRESRLPLRLRGEGQGPLVEFSSHTLNIGNVFVNSSHIHEVELINKGALDAPFIYIPSTTNVGSCFKFEPEEGIIAAGGNQTIQIAFSATVLGSFEEEFQFSVAGSPMPAILTIKGSVTVPSLEFDVDEINYGEISFGFPHTQRCRLTNSSPVPVTFQLRMSDDGTQPAVDSLDQIRREGDPSWRNGIHFYLEPKEFTINPSQGTILPQGHQDIEVTLCSNSVVDFYRRMLVDLEGFGKGVTALVITARCLVPELRVYPEILLYDECHLNVPYERKFLIANDTDFPGCYGLIPQEREEDSPVLYSSPKPCGIVQPHSFAEVPVIIKVQTLDKHRTDVLIGVFGDERNPLRPELRSTGQLAQIYPSPRLIEFGKIPALQPTSRSLTLFNKGHVPTDFRMEVVRKRHCCTVEPSEGVIPAGGEVPVTVTATLDDRGLFSVPVRVFIGSNRSTAFGLVALGTGTTIVIDKPFSPELNLGYQFSLVPCIRQFKVTNRGHHFHRLFWSVECYSPSEQEGQSVSALSSPKDDSQSPKRAEPLFGLEPLSMDLQPGRSEDMVLRGFSSIAQEVQDYVMCEAVSMATSRTEKIMETVITCKFIHPSIELSARHLSFQVTKKPSDLLRLQYQPLAIKNTCLLPLDLMLGLEQPFLVCDKEKQPLPDGQPVRVGVGETCHLYIAFDPAYKLDFKSWKTEKLLKIDMVRGHPLVERIILRGEVHFPNLQMQSRSLEFGCIVAGTEEVRSLKITNCSPLPVQYHWSFHSKSQVYRLSGLGSRASGWTWGEGEGEIGEFSLEKLAQILQVPRYYSPLELVGTMPPRDVLHTPVATEEAPPGTAALCSKMLFASISMRNTSISPVLQVFSILPLSGVLQPGESQQVSFTFCSHFNTISFVTALCHVEGGPTYELMLTGEASCISYSVSPRETYCGSQLFNEIHHSNVTLENTGKMEFNWVLNPSPADQRLPGVFLVNPTTGSIAPGEKQVLEFSYMPGLPGAFSRTYHLKVGDLEPEKICLKGEASFPMITLNLPWNIKGDETHEKPLTQPVKPLQQHSQRSKSGARKKTQSLKTETLKSQTAEAQTPKSLIPKTKDLQPSVLASGTATNTQLQLNMVRNLVVKAAVELQEQFMSQPPTSSFPDKELCQSLVKAGNSLDSRWALVLVAVTRCIVELPEYVLDMGTVRKGFTERSTLEITNHGQIPVSFQIHVSVLENTGFSVDLDTVEGLPHSYIKTFDVRFESARRPRGDVDVVLPIEVTKGPTYNIRLHATVSELSIELSKNTVHYSAVVVGQYKVETVHLYNWFRVPCKWSIKPVQKTNHCKYMTPAVRQKQQALEYEPCPFEVKPSKGTLDPGRCQNLKIKFTPKEERSYSNELELNIFGSSNHFKLYLSGQGLEPRLEFSPPELEMGWMLVDSDGMEATVVVKNPCNFPIEFYALDFDEQYLEKKILRMAEESEDHEAQKWLKAELKARAEAEAKAMGKAAAARHRAITFHPESVAKVAGIPFSRAVLRPPGTAPSSWRRKAQPHRGIVVIVHGPPRAGKTEIAAGLCQYYGAAHVSIDTVVKEAMANNQSPAGLRARLLCTQAALEQKGKKLTAQSKNKEAAEENIYKKYAKGKNLPAQKKEPAKVKGTKFTVSTAPAPQQLSIVSSRGEELNCLSCVLPEELLVDILSERLQQKDCYKGVVFDGLESLFASSLESSLLCVLRAVKNCHHIYVVNLQQDYASWKAKNKAERKKKEAQREKEVDEDEHDALPEEKKAKVDKILQERKRTQTEGELKQPAQKLEEEAKALEQEERQKEEEKLKKEKKVSFGKQPAKAEKEIKAPEKKETKAPEKGAPKAPQKRGTKAPQKRGTKASGKGRTKVPKDPAEILILRFQIYESSQQDMAQVFSYWDRVQGTVQLPVIQKGNKSQPAAGNKGWKASKPQEKVKKQPKPKHEGQRSLQSSQLRTQSKVAEGAVRDKHVGVPCLDIQVADPKAMIGEILRDGKLPTEDQLLKHLGLHPDGPPLAPGAALSIAEYPEAKAPDAKGSSAERQPKRGKVVSSLRSAKENQISTQRTESSQDSSVTRSQSPSEVLERASTPAAFLRLKRYRWKVPAQGQVELKVNFFTKKPGKFEQTMKFEIVLSKRQYELPCSVTGLYPSIIQNPRLVFPHWRETMEEDEVIFKEYVESTKQFHFGPLLCGKSREWYEVQNCPGNSEKLTILNNSPMVIEVHFSFEKDWKTRTFVADPRRMTLKPKEGKELTIWAYPTSPGLLEDKLICSIRKNPEPVVFSLCCHGVDMKLEVSPLQLSFDKLLLHRADSRTLVLKNNTLLPMAWQLRGLGGLFEDFSLSQDNGILDPHSEFQVTVHFKAEHIGSIEKILQLEVSDTENILGNFQAENIKISAEVYEVSLSIDMPEGADGSLEFGTINVLDKVKKVLSLQNKGVYNIEYSFTLKGAGPKMQDLASHFTVEPQSGVLIASRPGEKVEMLFHPTSEMVLKNNPILYCQVADASPGRGRPAVANIPVRVSAEAEYSKYSIVPASPTDFGAMIVGTRKTRSVVLKNIGMANFTFCIRQTPKLACALESKSSKQRKSAPSATKRSTGKESSLSTPVGDSCCPAVLLQGMLGAWAQLEARAGHTLCWGAQGTAVSHQPPLELFLQSHLNLGAFTVSPCCGCIRPCGLQVIKVECLAGQEGTCEQQLYIDIMGRDPKDNPLGIPFTLIVESCLPALVQDVTSVFKDYPICSSADLEYKLQSLEGMGLFVRDENRFIFNKVLVGQEAEAHFRICNAGRLPCDVALSILPGEEQIPINNIFNLDPVKMSIRGSSSAIATVTFTPPDKQSYDCTFKASLVIPKGSVEVQPQILTFTISGKGQELPVTVVRPNARSKRGTAVLRFKRLQLEHSEMLPLVLRNSGTKPVKFMLQLEDEHGAFSLKGRAFTFKTVLTGEMEEDSVRNETKPPKQTFILLRHGQSAQFKVIFKPTLAQRVEGKIALVVGDICMTLVELVGEGHNDEFTLDGLKEDTQERNAKSSLRKDIIDAVRVNHIEFGHCPVGKRCRRTFTITNRTLTQAMRFEWDADAPFQFSPKVGHLHPGCAKNIAVILRSDVPVTFRRHLVKCKVTKINFELPRRKVLDWDDQMRTVTVKDTTWKDPAGRWPKKEKVVEPVLEPAHTVVEESSQEAEVYLSAVVAHAQFKLSTTVVEFKDTLPFQTRTAFFRLCNTGKIALEYSWEEAGDSEAAMRTALARNFLSSETLRRCRNLLHHFGWQQDQETQAFELRLLQRLAKHLQDSKRQQFEELDHPKKLRNSKRVGSALEIFPDAIYDLPLFSIKPYHGIITPGQKQAFQVQFSPKCAGMFQTTLLCRISNLNPAEKMRQVTVKGRALEQKILGRADGERPGSQGSGALESST